MNLKGKVALVTGASRGIGKSIAIELCKEGASVVLNYKKQEAAAQETLKCIQALGGYGRVVQGDVSDFKTSHQMIQDIVRDFGKIDILVNNAAISKIGLFMDTTEEGYEEILNTNLKGVFNCAHAVVPPMISQKSGCIINISSIWGQVGASCEVLYSMTKGGVNAFTKALAKELGPSHIRVNAIAPGVIDTEMNQWLSEEEKEKLVEEIPMQRFGKGEEIGRLVAFLASEAASYITGQIITVDGGML